MSETIQIIFEKQTEYGNFRDALYLPIDHSYTEEDIEAMKQRRVDNWIAAVTAPPAESLPEDG